MGGGGLEPLLGLVRNQVRGHDPRPTRCRQVCGEAVHAVLHDQVPIGHQDGHGVRSLGDRPDHAEGVIRAHALGEGLRGGCLDDLAIHDGIGVRQTDLDDIGPAEPECDGGLDGLLDAGIAGGQVADQRGSALRAALLDARGQPGVGVRGQARGDDPIDQGSRPGQALGLHGRLRRTGLLGR